MANGKSICTVCNYIFDETVGEPRKDVPSGTRFENLPEEWLCPDCNSNKEMFQPCSCVDFHSPHNHGSHQGASQAPTTCNMSFSKTAVDELSSKTVGELVALRPQRAYVFEQFGIDYCCGGKKTLIESCKQKGIPVEELINRLRAADELSPRMDEPDWTKTTLKELVDHIITCYHNPLREQLPRLSQMALKVAKVHGANHPEMVKVSDILSSFKESLEMHMQKEEMILFPAISRIEAGGSPKLFGCGGGIEHPISVMLQEHDDAGEALCAMSKLTNGYTPPPDACNTFRVLLRSLADLESEMHQHVHKENNILFPRALSVAAPTSVPM